MNWLSQIRLLYIYYAPEPIMVYMEKLAISTIILKSVINHNFLNCIYSIFRPKQSRCPGQHSEDVQFL